LDGPGKTKICQCTSHVLLMTAVLNAIYYDLKHSCLIRVVYSLSVLHTVSFLLLPQSQFCFFPFAFDFCIMTLYGYIYSPRISSSPSKQNVRSISTCLFCIHYLSTHTLTTDRGLAFVKSCKSLAPNDSCAASHGSGFYFRTTKHMLAQFLTIFEEIFRGFYFIRLSVLCKSLHKKIKNRNLNRVIP
jgi:hypothetical protein